MSLSRILNEVRGCQICSANLPFGPDPFWLAASTARLVIIRQVPGSNVHQSGVPWNDASGDRLRDWLELDQSAFRDEARVAILPMGFGYPGAGENRGDKPPRPECLASARPLSTSVATRPCNNVCHDGPALAQSMLHCLLHCSIIRYYAFLEACQAVL